MIELRYPFDALVSFHYFRNDEHMEKVTESGRLRLIGDSGAFSAFTQGSEITLPDYAAWVKQWRSRLYWAAALDVFGDPDATLANFRTLRDKYGLVTVPTLHIGGDPKWIDVYAREGVDFMGLGGMVGMPAPAVFRWLVHVFRHVRDHQPQMRFHTWGMTRQSVLEKLPIYSADSSGLLGSAYRYATLQLWDTRARKQVQIKLDGKEPYRHRRLLTEQYGVSPKDIARSHAGNRTILIRITALAVQRRTETLTRRHQVSPPTWGIQAPSRAVAGTRCHVAEANIKDFVVLGPRIHVVDGSSAHLATVARASEGES